MSIWSRTSIWEKINHTVQLFGTSGQLTFVATHSDPIWNYVTGGAQLLVMILSIWMEDRDKNGIVDLFETTKTKTTVEFETTSVPGSPAQTEVVDIKTEKSDPS